jgi:hypothetical protein
MKSDAFFSLTFSLFTILNFMAFYVIALCGELQILIYSFSDSSGKLVVIHGSCPSDTFLSHLL